MYARPNIHYKKQDLVDIPTHTHDEQLNNCTNGEICCNTVRTRAMESLNGEFPTTPTTTYLLVFGVGCRHAEFCKKKKTHSKKEALVSKQRTVHQFGSMKQHKSSVVSIALHRVIRKAHHVPQNNKHA